jgi:hypothetical protein
MIYVLTSKNTRRQTMTETLIESRFADEFALKMRKASSDQESVYVGRTYILESLKSFREAIRSFTSGDIVTVQNIIDISYAGGGVIQIDMARRCQSDKSHPLLNIQLSPTGFPVTLSSKLYGANNADGITGPIYWVEDKNIFTCDCQERLNEALIKLLESPVFLSMLDFMNRNTPYTPHAVPLNIPA